MLLIKFGLFFLSIIGYILFFRNQFKVKVEFAPAIVCASCSGIMFLAGILNLMPITVAIIFVIGIALLLQNIKKSINDKRTWIIICLWLLVLGYFAVLLRGAILTHYDNFSHWALVVKCMLMNDRMPNFADKLITFQAYPLGSSLWIYFVCKVIGTTEACYMFAQVIMLISFIFPLTVWINKKNIYLCIIPILYAIYSLSSNVAITNLLVDTLMPLAGVAAFCIIEYERDMPQKTMFETLPLFIFLIQVKNSGIFFIAICIIYWLSVSRQQIIRQRKLLFQYLGIDVITPFFTFVLWKKHVEIVFANGEVSKHAMSISNYRSVFFEKTNDVIFNIGKKMMSAVFDFSSWNSTSGIWVMIAITAILLIAVIHCAIKRGVTSQFVKAIFGIWGVYFIYMVSVFAMYIFSMPLEEAENLASFGRYAASVIIFIYGIANTILLKEWSNNGMAIIKIMPVLIMLFIVFKLGSETEPLYKKMNTEGTIRKKFQDVVTKYEVEHGKKYVIYITKNDSGYMYYISRYELWSTTVSVISGGNIEDHEQDIGNADYLIICESNDATDSYLKDNNLQQYIGKSEVSIKLQ